MNRFSRITRRGLSRSVFAAAIIAGAAQAVHAQYYWDPGHTAGSVGGGSGTWDNTTPNWDLSGTDTDWVDGNVADFGGTAGTVTIGASVSPTTINFNSTGYILSVGASGNSNTVAATTINVASGDYAVIGTNASTSTGGLAFPSGLTVGNSTYNGELVLAQNVVTTGQTVTVNGGSTLTLGDRTISGDPAPYNIFNNNSLDLNSSTLQIGTSASATSSAFKIAAINVTGTSTLSMYRTGTSGSSASANMTSTALTMGAGGTGATLIANAADTVSDSTGGAYFSTGNVTLNGPSTFQVNTGTDSGGYTYVEDFRLGNYTDNSYTSTFIGSGSSTVLGGYVELSGSYNGSGNWVLGSSNAANPQGVAIQLYENNGGMTNGPSIIVNPYSQIYIDNNGTGTTNWGASTQTITVSGAFAPLTDTSLNAGSLVFADGTNGTNVLVSNVNVAASTTFYVNGTGTTAQFSGNITGGSGASITKNGAGTMVLAGGANTWSGGIIINTGNVQVNAGSSLGSGPVTLAANNSTNTANAVILENATQTIGPLSSSFGSSTAGTNTVELNGATGTALNIIESSASTFGNSTGYPATQHSVISGTGSLSIDASSTANLTLSSANTFAGPVTINAGGILLTGSFTASTAVTVGDGTHNALFGGNGSATGLVTVNAHGTIFPGAATPAVGSMLSLPGGLTLKNNSTTEFDLDTPTDSDQIALGAGSLTLNGTINLQVNNIGALAAGGTYPLITYSGSGPALGANSSFNITGITGASVSIASLGNGEDALDLVVPEATPLYWAAGNNTWDTTTANWKLNGSPATFSNGSVVIFDDTGGSSSPITVTLNTTVQPAETTFNNNSRNYLLTGAGSIGGSGGVVVSGTGTVTLATANTFTGNVTIDGGGTLSVGADAALGDGDIVNISNNSTLAFTGAAIADSRTFTLGAGGGIISVASADTATLSGAIGGAGGLTVAGPGTLVLSGGAANTYGGATLVQSGTLQIGKSGSVPISSALTIDAGATFDTQTYTDIVASVNELSSGLIKIGSTGTFEVAGTANSTIAGEITGPANSSLENSGTGTLDLTAMNAASTFGNVYITAGGTVLAGSYLGAGAINMSTAGSTLEFTKTYSSPTQILSNTTTGTNINLNGQTVTLGALDGTNTTVTNANFVTGLRGPNILNGTLILAGTDGTINGLTIGDGTNPATVIVTNSDPTTDVSGLGEGSGSDGGVDTIENGSTLEIKNSGAGVLVVGLPGASDQDLTTLTFYGNSTFVGVGAVEYTGDTSPSIGPGATTTFEAPGATDKLIINSAIRNADGAATGGTQDTTNNITVAGSGTVQIASGGVSQTTVTQFGGTWTVNSGVLLFEGVAGGIGEILNAPGYGSFGNYAATDAITLNGGVLALGADQNNPAASAPTSGLALTGLNSFRSPVNVNGNAAISSAGLEYNTASSISTGGIVFDSTPVSANFDGDLSIAGGVTLTVDTFDPVAGEGGGSRNINFASDTFNVDQANPYDNNNENPPVTGNITYGSGSSIVTASGGYAGGALNIARIPLNIQGFSGGVVSVGSGASITVSSGTTVNVGKDLPGGAGSVLTPVALSIDPFTDTNVSSNPTDSDTTQSLAASVSGTLDYAGPTGQTNPYGTGVNDTGIKVYRLSTLAIQSGGTVKLDTSASEGDTNGHADRTLLVIGALYFGGTGPLAEIGPDSSLSPPAGGLDITNNDVLLHNASLTGLSAELKAGEGGVSGIYSSVASLATGTGVGLVDANYYGYGDASPPTTFDGMSLASNDAMIKYTYFGDLNLDGTVNSADLAMMGKVPTTGPDAGVISWFDGDLNYDGTINSDDYSLFMLGDAAYSSHDSSLASVPEPAALSAAALPLLLGLRRRRR